MNFDSVAYLRSQMNLDGGAKGWNLGYRSKDVVCWTSELDI